MQTTRDAFLGGKVHALQPARGYRAGVDAVLLAASIPAVSNDHVLELGCGVGVASLCLMARTRASVTGVEIQTDYAGLARENGLDVVEADLSALPANLRNSQFQHVMMNPPYFNRTAGSASEDAGRDTAMGGGTPLSDWLIIGAKRLAPKGTLTMINRIENLPQALASLPPVLGSAVVLPVTARAGRAPHLFILQARHSGRAPFRMAPPLILHQGDRHEGDRESYTSAVRAVLRNGANLSLAE